MSTDEGDLTSRKRRRTVVDYQELSRGNWGKRSRSGKHDGNSSPAQPPLDEPVASSILPLGRKRRISSGRGRPSGSSSSRRSHSDVYDFDPADQAGEIPDAKVAEQREPERASARSRRSSARDGRKSVYDFPESSDELQTECDDGPAGKKAKSPPGAALNGASPRQESGKGRRSVRKSGLQGVEVASDQNGASSLPETPSKRRSSTRKPAPAAGAPEATTPTAARGAIGDDDELNSSRRLFGATHGDSRAVDESHVPTPRPKGILTPRGKGKEARQRKSVAFENGGGGRAVETEVYFEDLPSKSTSKVGRPPAARSNPKPAAVEPVHEGRDAGDGEDVEEEEEEEEDDDDEEVCAFCHKPDSAPPNEIIFCDGCDVAVHQDCYGIPEVPEGDWLCRECSRADGPRSPGSGLHGTAPPVVRKEDVRPDIPNFEQHLCWLQRVLLDRCTGRRRIKLRDQDEAYDKTLQLIEQTVVAGEGNSMLVIGARGSGKTTLVESAISAMSLEHKDEFHVVRLNGFIHTDDKLAMKEIWRQLGREMDVEDDLINRTNNYADTLASLLALLSHPSELAGAQDGVTSRSVIFVMDEFDLFATHARQTLLYNLFDIAQAKKAPIAVLGLTTRIDVVESLEKRVKSRFSHRYVYLSLPKSLPAYRGICQRGLVVDKDDQEKEGADSSLQGTGQFLEWWSMRVEAMFKEPQLRDRLEYHFYATKSVSAFLTSCILPLSLLSPGSLSLGASFSGDAAQFSLEEPDSKLHLLESLSDLDLSLLIAAARLDIVAHTDTVNFAMAYDEYTSLMSRQRAQTASSGLLAAGGGTRVWGRGVGNLSWERLVGLGLVVPAGPAGRAASAAGSGARAGGGSSLGGLESKMCKVDVALEEIPAAVKLNAVLARWCKEI